NPDLLRRIPKRMGDGALSYFSNRDRAWALGRRDLGGLYAARLSQDFYGNAPRTLSGLERTCRSSTGLARAGDAVGRCVALLRVFPAIVCANCRACVSHLPHRK